MSYGNTTPILRIFDEDKAKEFYIEFLGFTIDCTYSTASLAIIICGSYILFSNKVVRVDNELECHI